MNFNSLFFLFVFLPVTLVAYYTLPRNFRLYVLSISSLVFYGASGHLALILLIFSILAAFLIIRYRSILGNFNTILISVFPLFLILGLFKYLGYFLSIIPNGQQYESSFDFFLDATLPAGISFYTFQIVAYVVDVVKQRVKEEEDPVLFISFISFFPQLVAGPIVRFNQLRDQLHAIKEKATLSPQLSRGIKLLATGLFFKTFGSDVLSLFHDQFQLNQDANSLDALYALFSYSIIIYVDFWAYSLMAIGLGLMFGLTLPKNFREPYQSKNPKEFWRRWHITLSFWLKDYLYIPLGGNKKYIIAILVTFAATGLWHGAGAHFVIWGMYHAIGVLIYHYTKTIWSFFHDYITILITFVFVAIGWPLFYLHLYEWMDLIKLIFTFEYGFIRIYNVYHWLYLLPLFVWMFLLKDDCWLFNNKKLLVLDHPITHAIMIFISILFFDFSRDFIYFRF